MRHRTLGFLIIVLGGCLAAAVLQAKPNVVVFFTDDQGTLDAGCYGSDDLLTPAIDKLAKTGVRFTPAYAHTVCLYLINICRCRPPLTCRFPGLLLL